MVSFGFLAMGLGLDAAQHESVRNVLPGSDLSLLEASIDEIIAGLTTWQPHAKKRLKQEPAKVTIEGNDYFDALAKLNTTFLKNKWGDGLPVLPATEDQVKWILTGTDLRKDTIIGKIPPLNRIVTVEALAVCLAMTGGRPEYLPVLIATMKAFLNPQLRAVTLQTTTCSVSCDNSERANQPANPVKFRLWLLRA